MQNILHLYWNCFILKSLGFEFKIKFNLTIVQQDVTYSVYYITVGSSTCVVCWHPSSGARTAVITASGID